MSKGIWNIYYGVEACLSPFSPALSFIIRILFKSLLLNSDISLGNVVILDLQVFSILSLDQLKVCEKSTTLHA